MTEDRASEPHGQDVQPLGRALRRAEAAIDALMASRIEAAGISFVQIRALHAVCEGAATTPGGLSVTMGMTTGATTRLVDSLEGHGWLTRKRRKDDRRVIELGVTDAGRAMATRVSPIVFQAWRDVLAGWDPAGIDALTAYLTDIARLADDLRTSGTVCGQGTDRG